MGSIDILSVLIVSPTAMGVCDASLIASCIAATILSALAAVNALPPVAVARLLKSATVPGSPLSAIVKIWTGNVISAP